MLIECVDEELEALIFHNYKGKYKSYKSNATLIRDLDKVIRILSKAKDITEVSKWGNLAYERLKNSPYSSVRVGYRTKYRLEFEEHENKITLVLIKLSEHYGEH